MPEYALIQGGNTVLKVEVKPSQPPDVPHKGFSWLPYVVSFPAYDPELEKLGPETVTIEPTRVLRTAVALALTAGEIDARKDAKVNGIAKVIFEATFNHENRIRALEGLGSITRAQLKTALKAFI